MEYAVFRPVWRVEKVRPKCLARFKELEFKVNFLVWLTLAHMGLFVTNHLGIW